MYISFEYWYVKNEKKPEKTVKYNYK